MKSKVCFALTILFVLLFSIGIAAASDNSTNNMVNDNSQLENQQDNPEMPVTGAENSKNPSDDDADVSVDISVKNEYSENPTIKVKVTNNGKKIAKKTTAMIDMYNLKYISHTADAGKYNPKTGEWNIGTLNPFKTCTLTIKTEKEFLGCEVSVYATSQSTESNYSNNFEEYFLDFLVSATLNEEGRRESYPHSYYEKNAYSDYRVVVDAASESVAGETKENVTGETEKSENNTLNNTTTPKHDLFPDLLSNPISILCIVLLFCIICLRKKFR